MSRDILCFLLGEGHFYNVDYRTTRLCLLLPCLHPQLDFPQSLNCGSAGLISAPHIYQASSYHRAFAYGNSSVQTSPPAPLSNLPVNPPCFGSDFILTVSLYSSSESNPLQCMLVVLVLATLIPNHSHATNILTHGDLIHTCSHFQVSSLSI